MRLMDIMNASQNSLIDQPESGKNGTPFSQTMVQLSKQAYIQLKWDSRYWRRQHDRAIAREAVLKQENERLQAVIRDLKQRLYGKRSEKTATQTEALPLNGQKTMTWKGISPVIKLMETTYQKGVWMTKKAFNALANRIDRDASLPRYYLTVRPQV